MNQINGNSTKHILLMKSTHLDTLKRAYISRQNLSNLQTLKHKQLTGIWDFLIAAVSS